MYYIKQYYGMSGCFKRTTIQAGINGDKNKIALWSDIKPWKHYEKLMNLEQNDLNYAALHLCKLKNFIYDIPFSKDFIKTILVERGVSDMLFYWSKKNGEDEKIFNKILKEEDVIVEQNSYYTAEKILLIQKDIDFIKDVVLKEKTRSDCFPGGVEDYLKQQEEYINFTQKYNKITSIINIKDAEKYIKDLGFEYNPGK